MTQYERMVNGLIYDPLDSEIMEEQIPFQDKLWAFNQLKPSDNEKKTAYMKEVFAECGDNCYIELPFHANWGGHHVHFGSDIYVNSNLTMVDDGHIYVGDKVMFGPNVTIATANRNLIISFYTSKAPDSHHFLHTNIREDSPYSLLFQRICRIYFQAGCRDRSVYRREISLFLRLEEYIPYL